MTMRMRAILRWLYPLFFFSLPFQTRWIVRDAVIGGSAWEYGRMSIYGFDIVLACICLCAFISLSKRGIKGRGEIQGLMAGVGVLAVTYALFVSLNPLLTAAVLARIVSAAFAGWFLIRHMDIIVLRRALTAFVFAMVISAGFGVAQFLVQTSLIESKWLGVSEQDPSLLGVSVIEAQGGRWLRAHGTMPHPNALGGFSALGLVLFLLLTMETSPSNAFDWRLSPSKEGIHTISPLRRGREATGVQWTPRTRMRGFIDFTRYTFVAAAPLILIAGIFTSASRAALIAAAVGVISVFMFTVRHFSRRSLVIPLAGMAAGILIILIAALPVLLPRLTARGRLESISIERRLSAFDESVRAFQAYGVLGTGLGSYTVALQTLFPEKKIWEQQPVHNVLLLILIELGIGGVLILGFGWLFLKKKPEARSQKPETGIRILNSGFLNLDNGFWKKLFIPALICWLVLAMLDHYLWTLPTGLYLSVLLWLVFIFRQHLGPPQLSDKF